MVSMATSSQEPVSGSRLAQGRSRLLQGHQHNNLMVAVERRRHGDEFALGSEEASSFSMLRLTVEQWCRIISSQIVGESGLCMLMY